MADEVCPFCTKARHAAEACPRVAAIEYEPDPKFPLSSGARVVKRIEFHKPVDETDVIKSFFGDPDKPRPYRRWYGPWL